MGFFVLQQLRPTEIQKDHLEVFSPEGPYGATVREPV